MKLELKKKPQEISLGENILIDLMPSSYREVVEMRTLKRRAFYAIIATLVIFIVASLGVYTNSAIVSSSLKTERSTHASLDSQIAEYAEVNQALESQKESKKLLNQGASSEIDWNKLIKTVSDSLPNNTQILSLSSVAGDPATGKNVAGVLLSLSSKSDLQYSDSLASIRNISGVSDVKIGPGQRSGEDRFNYQISFTYDHSILTGRFISEEAKQKASANNETPTLGDNDGSK